jgi:hypothetical protein
MPPEQAPRRIANDLWRYGEDHLAARALDLTRVDVHRIEALASRMIADEGRGGPPILFSMAVALAAVQTMDRQRPLAKRRRRPQGKSPYWA